MNQQYSFLVIEGNQYFMYHYQDEAGIFVKAGVIMDGGESRIYFHYIAIYVKN